MLGVGGGREDEAGSRGDDSHGMKLAVDYQESYFPLMYARNLCNFLFSRLVYARYSRENPFTILQLNKTQQTDLLLVELEILHRSKILPEGLNNFLLDLQNKDAPTKSKERTAEEVKMLSGPVE